MGTTTLLNISMATKLITCAFMTVCGSNFLAVPWKFAWSKETVHTAMRWQIADWIVAGMTIPILIPIYRFSVFFISNLLSPTKLLLIVDLLLIHFKRAPLLSLLSLFFFFFCLFMTSFHRLKTSILIYLT